MSEIFLNSFGLDSCFKTPGCKCVPKTMAGKIFYHCVIHSFYNSLSNYPESNFPNNNEHLFLKTYDMVAKNDYFFTNSVSSIISSPAPSELQRKDDAAQYRAKYAQRYRTFINFPDEYYSKYLLQTVLHELPKEAGNQKQNSHFNVPLILNIWSDFLYSDRSVHHFDRALAKNTSLLNIYGTLSSEYEDLVESCHANIDKLFVSYPLENTYGFHTLAGIAKLLSNFETQNTLNTKDYSDLTTDSFFKTLNLLFKNPLVYNRHFLIRYACDAIMNGAFAEPGYLKTKASTVTPVALISDDPNVVPYYLPLHNHMSYSYFHSSSLKISSSPVFLLKT